VTPLPLSFYLRVSAQEEPAPSVSCQAPRCSQLLSSRRIMSAVRYAWAIMGVCAFGGAWQATTLSPADGWIIV